MQLHSDSDQSTVHDDDEDDDGENYESILNDLKSQWLQTEVQHCVSKTASEIFWKIGLSFIPKLNTANENKKKTPQFNSIRQKMYQDLLPKVDLRIGYKNKATGEVLEVNDTITRRKQFPSNKFEKLYEIGTINVSLKN